jgi:hypothetical protein
MNEIGLLKKRITRKLPQPWHHVRTQQEGTIYEPESALINQSASTVISEFPQSSNL